MKLSSLFYNCTHIAYIHLDSSLDYATRVVGSTLYIYFQGSDGLVDWKNNLDFPVVAHKRGGRTIWYAHRGFLGLWKSVEEILKSEILNTGYKKIVTVGYSHGGALAILCHEFIWYQRPDLRDVIEGYGFGCPRVIWGIRSKDVLKRWERFYVIRNIDDIVTHLPPFIFGYFHVGNMIKVGRRGSYSRIDAHREENLLYELRVAEKEK